MATVNLHGFVMVYRLWSATPSPFSFDIVVDPMAIYYFSLISRMLLNMNVTLLFCYGQPSACFVYWVWGCALVLPLIDCCDSIPNKLTADDLNFNLSRFGFNPRSVDTATTQHSHIAVDCNNMSMSLTCALFVFIRMGGSSYIIRSVF